MKIDINKTYYKITNEKEKHNGLQYKTGLVKDVLPFNDNKDEFCVPGRIYITDLEHLPEFFGYGCWIRPLTVPKDVLYVEEKYKIGVNKVLMKDRISFEEYFKKWFDPEIFNWEYLINLIIYCSKCFDEWFDPKKFNWIYSHHLAIYCSEHFEKWFNPKKFDWDYSSYLAEYCSEHFEKWFDPKKFNWLDSDYLAEYCNEYFDKWFDPKKFNWNDSYFLTKYCSDYKYIWEKYIKK